MDVHADLTKPAELTPEHWQWVDSPQAGVRRVMLDRVGDEVAVATSFVRYAENSTFPTHQHALGEEFLVLEGEFGDEHGRYPAGTYVRNPVGTSHAPFSEPGCLIWVKLRQFDLDDQEQFSLLLDSPIPDSGHDEVIVHSYQNERVRELVAAPGTQVALGDPSEVEELLVLEGSVAMGESSYPRWSWLRMPVGASATLEVVEPLRALVKTRPVYRET